MKRLLTLFVLLALFLGAKAEWNQVYTIDYSTYRGFPFYVMGYVPEFDNGCMTDYGAMYGYKTDSEMEEGEFNEVGTVITAGGAVYHKVQLDAPAWHQYFIADNIQTKLDGKYKVVAKVKASAACSAVIQMRWNWGEDPASISVAIPDSADFQKVEWEYSGIGGTSCSLIAQPGSSTETIEWQNLTVYEWVKAPTKPTEWLEDIENGDAETPWGDLANVMYNDTENNFKICAWSKEKGRNMNEYDSWNPFPADIEVDPLDASNHVFVVHGQPATTEGDASSWDNQFWIQSQHAWKAGLTLKIKFRYRCNYNGGDVTTNTQMHKQTPSDYLIWHAIGDITFTNEWQTFDATMTIGDDMAGGWSIGFNLNSEVKDAVNFYFDDLSWQYMKLDEGYFLAGINKNVTDSYDDLGNAIEFMNEDWALVATIGEKGNPDSYVDQLMISTTRGDDQAFKGATLKPQNRIKNDPKDWNEYVASANAKLNVPGLGVWKVYLDPEYTSMAFEMLEGIPYEEKQPIDIFTNTTDIVINAPEREDLMDTYSDSGITVREEMDDPAGVEVGGEGHEGQTWDNQFFIKANRALAKGEVTKLVFKYKSSIAEAKTSTMCFAEEPGVYMHWAAIGDVTFTDEWQLFEKEFIVPDAADGMWSIGFNMAEIKDACDYYIKDVQWYLFDESLDYGQTYENLINAGGTANFYMKLGAGNSPVQYGGDDTNIVWTIAGSSESVFGTTWDPTNTSNDMRQIEPGVFLLEKKNVRLEAGEVIEYKVVGNHSWDINYGENGEPDGWNMTFSVGQTDFYDLYFYFYRNSGNILSCTYQYASSGIEPNPTEVIVYAMERDDLSDNETDGIREEEGGTGEVWDNQFWIVANRNLAAGETTILEFDYMSSDYASTRTEFHEGPSEYLHWDALGEIYFTPYWQHYRTAFTVPSEADNMKSIAFDMAVVKEARDYHIRNVVWRVSNSQESLINQEGSENFYVRIGANTEPYMYNGDSQENLFALLTAQIQTSNAALEKLNYANVPGAADLRTLIEAAQAITIESDVETIKNSFTQLRSLTLSVVNMDTQYKALEDLMVRIETVIQNNPDADATLAAEAINKMIEVRAALNSGAYNLEELWRMTSIMNDYYYALSKVYLTINVTMPGTLRSLINEKGFDASSIVGLTVSGTLDYDDINFIQNMYELEMLNIKETNITEIWSWMFSGRNLKKVVMPKNLQRLGDYAFSWCYNLEEVELPESLQEISYNVFEGCEKLKSITYNTIIPVSPHDYLMSEYYSQNCTLYVPAVAVSFFQSNYYWSKFRIVGTDVMPEEIFIARNITLDWPEGLGTSVKPNVTIGYSDYNGFGSLTLNGNSTVSMSNFNMLWSPRRSSYSSTYDDATGTYSWYRYAYGSLVANAPMRADNVSVLLETSSYRWDFLTFPFDVKVSDIINTQQNNAPLVIRRYDGKNRADGKMGETWVDMTPDMTLEAGKGYIWQSAEGDQGNSENNFTVTALDNAKKNNLFTTGDVTVELDEFISEFSQNRSWNLIGNPYPAFYDIRGMQTAAPITIWNGYNNVYQAYVPGEDDYILNPGQAFFIQRPLDQETLTFIKEGRQADLGIRNWDTNSTRAAANKERYVFNLILSGSEEVQGDRTRIVFDATAKADYEAGHDASKFMSPEASAAQIFTTNGDVRYAINERPAMEGIVELGLSIGTAGSYTIALNTNVENEVYLIDRLTGMETRIDGGSTYTFQATKGISEGRFAVRFGNGEVTGIKAIATDGKNSDNWYNLKGQRVNAPTKGLYIQNGKKTVVK